MSNPNFETIINSLKSLSESVQELTLKMDEILVEEEKEFDCNSTKDILELGDFTIQPDHSCWQLSKKAYLREECEDIGLFYIEVDQSFTSLSIQEAKKLRNYLNERIDYLEGES